MKEQKKIYSTQTAADVSLVTHAGGIPFSDHERLDRERDELHPLPFAVLARGSGFSV
jgi:hypothetical protein